MKIKAKSESKLKQHIRWHILLLLDKIENQQEYSNVVINRFLQQSPFDERDNRLLVQIIYGVIQHRYTLNYYLDPIIKGKKIDKWVLTLLRMSVYQLVFLDRIPDHAVVNEAVLIAKTNGHQRLGNFVNALLRNFMREPLPSISTIKPLNERWSIQYSIELWLVDYLLDAFGESETLKLLESIQLEPFVSGRVNTSKRNRSEVINLLKEEDVVVEESRLSPVGFRAVHGNLINTESFKAGYYTIQDESSMLVAPLGNIKGDEQILDACAAPGGKATHIASQLTSGHLTALDISATKLAKVDEHLERLDLSNLVTAISTDATLFNTTEDELYDMIYLDAPCSGLGLMRRKPEIKYQKSMEDVHNLVKVQQELISHMTSLLKVGGKLIYSTCTITYEENEGLVEWFLNQFPDFTVSPITKEEQVPVSVITDEGYIRIMPQHFQTDGFFISRFIKKDNLN